MHVRINRVPEEVFAAQTRGLEGIVGVPVMVSPSGKLWPKPADDNMTVRQEGEDWICEWR